MGEVKLKVMEALQEEAYKGIVRIDAETMREIGVRAGDIVEIEGGRPTVGIVDRAYPTDVGQAVIRMDGILRRNAKTGIGETVGVRKVEVKEAKQVTISPAHHGIFIKADPEIFKRGLLGRAVVRGDIVALGGAQRRRRTMADSPFFDDIFHVFEEEFMGNFSFGNIKFVIADSNPKGAVIVSENTQVKVNPKAVDVLEESRVPEVTYEDIGGLREEIRKVREMVELPLKHPELFERLGIQPPKGVLLHGPPGTGKTLLAKVVANETDAKFLLINGPEVTSKFVGEAEKKIRDIFEEDEKNAPSIIFIDEIDAIAAKREETYGEVEKRMVAQLLATMDGLKSRGRVIVIAATNRPNALDPALRRPGRFDREISFGVPTRDGRSDILKIHTRHMPIAVDNSLKNLDLRYITIPNVDVTHLDLSSFDLNNLPKHVDLNTVTLKNIDLKLLVNEADLTGVAPITLKNVEIKNVDLKSLLKNIDLSKADLKNVELQKVTLKNVDLKSVDLSNLTKEIYLNRLANMTHGFVGADMEALCKEAAMSVLRRLLPSLNVKENDVIPKEVLEKLQITWDDFMEGLKVVAPSALREVFVEVPNVKWEDIGGLEELKQQLKEAVEWPLKFPDSFKRLGVRPPKGVLLYGPPGCGKTLLAKAVANQSEANFILVKGPELISKWVGESERGIREIFKKARQSAPAIIFFDEIDSIAPRRGTNLSSSNVTERVVNQLLTEMDGLEELTNVVVVAATNRPDIMDPGLLRPGRFDRIILVPVPDKEARKKVFEIHTKNMPLAPDVKVEKLVEMTENYVGADIEAVCREAAILSLRENIDSKEVSLQFFELALKKVKSSIANEDIENYRTIEESYIRAARKGTLRSETNYFG